MVNELAIGHKCSYLQKKTCFKMSDSVISEMKFVTFPIAMTDPHSKITDSVDLRVFICHIITLRKVFVKTPQQLEGQKRMVLIPRSL
jgi:hypothetical protein